MALLRLRPPAAARALLAAGVLAASLDLARASEPRRPLVLILGDSIAAGLGLPASQSLAAQLQGALEARGVRAAVRASAVSGDTTSSALDRLDFSVPPETRICIVELGGNDFLQAAPPRRIEDNLKTIVSRLKARGVRVVIAGGRAPRGASGAYGEGFDAVFSVAARAGGIPVVPDLLGGVFSRPGLLQSDGVHPNAAGVKDLAQRLAPATARALREP